MTWLVPEEGNEKEDKIKTKCLDLGETSLGEAFSTYDLFTRLIVRHNIFDPSFTTQSGRKSIFEESMGL